MSEKRKILIVDDDPDIRNVLNLLLREDYETAEASNGANAVKYMKNNPETDLIVLDVMMPEMDGIETCKRIRKYSNAPILFLTAKSAEKDRLEAYRSGGDDFLSKPFSQPELLAKISSLLRRYYQYRGKATPTVYCIGNVEVNVKTHEVLNDGEPVLLTETEYAILEYLLNNRGRTVTTVELYESIRKEKFLPGSGNTIMVHVLNMRKKLEENPSSPRVIRTVWGKGYQID